MTANCVKVKKALACIIVKAFKKKYTKDSSQIAAKNSSQLHAPNLLAFLLPLLLQGD